MTDLDAVLARVVELCGKIQGIKKAADELPDDLDPSWLPYIYVDEGPAKYQYPSQQTIDVERDYMLLLFASQFGKTQRGNYGTEKEARKIARPFQISIPRFFAQARRLELEGQGINGVKYAICRADDGLSSASRRERSMSGIMFILTVGYSEYT